MERKYRIKWEKVDWRKTTKAIADDLAVHNTVVSYHRRRCAPWTIRNKESYVDWSGIDWSKPNRTIMAETGASQQSVSNARKKWASSQHEQTICIRQPRERINKWIAKAGGMPLQEWLASLADDA